MMGQAAKVKRERIETCMKCPICDKLLKEATTISLCLHTFCRKCIYKKLSDEESDCCPVCNIDLGCLPEEKLRPDHNLQDIRTKIFPLKRKIEALKILPTAPPQPKKKERLLSSLVVSTPKVSMQTGTTGRRTKALARRAASSRNSSFVSEEPNNKKKEDSSAEDATGGSSSQDSPKKLIKPKESSPDETSNERKLPINAKNSTNVKNEKFNLWTPLNCLVEAANRTKSSKQTSPLTNLAESANGSKSSKLSLQGTSFSKMDKPTGSTHNLLRFKTTPEGSLMMSKAKNKDPGVLQWDNNGTSSGTGSGVVKRKGVRGVNMKKAAASEVVALPAQQLLDVSGSKQLRRIRPVWFSLVALEDQKGEAPLPQIPACYLTIKDGSVPVSIIKKYIASKLHLTDESEVEILCRGQPVLPTLQLHHLVDLWIRTSGTSKRVTATVGTSAKDFVMVLTYCRKVQSRWS
ncbi:hypothetical protein SAY86_002466 [Trapa natans]|uniref:RING-type domain-containing protein n=1 Tax=Trapa natans TaxID=22666 RepID=A0AAN7R0Q8_TRANT|nr:hypothetical protein SAY86_002466 [Trapa natans]